MKKRNIIIIISVAIVAVVVILGTGAVHTIKKTQTTSGDEAWRDDGIELRRHEVTGVFGCFGCSEAGTTPAMCVDPIFEMKPATETAERYCNADFEVVEQ